MQVPMFLSLLGCLLTPSGATILGRCTVARKLQAGGLNYFEGYSLQNWVCLAYFESKFNPSAVYENSEEGFTGFGLFQIRSGDWCDHGKNLCRVSCFALLNPNLKETIACAKKIVKGKEGMGAWRSWSLNCQLSDTLDRWLDGCKLQWTKEPQHPRHRHPEPADALPFATLLDTTPRSLTVPYGGRQGHFLQGRKEQNKPH